MKKSEAAELVMMILAAYPNARTTASTSQVYETLLADLDVGRARAAVARLLGTSRWMPTVAEIREAAAALEHGAARTGEEAYAELTLAVRRHGRDYGQGAPKFRDPLIARCIGVWGSWNDLCGSAVDDPGGRARFIELYDELATRKRQDLAAGKPLPVAQSTTPAFWLNRPRVVAEAEPDPVPLAQAPVAQLLATLAPRRPANRDQAQPPRRWTAEELDQALGGVGK